MNTGNYNPDERCAQPVEDDCKVSSVEISFAIPSYITQAQRRQLYDLIREIADAPVNTPKEGVHWLSFTGSKLNFSRIDAALLGVPSGDNPPADGEEPIADDSILQFATYARGFATKRERDRTLEERRPSEFTCPRCGGHSFWSHTTEGGLRRRCGGRGQYVRVPIEGPQEPSIRCNFTWLEKDDQEYGLKPSA